MHSCSKELISKRSKPKMSSRPIVLRLPAAPPSTFFVTPPAASSSSFWVRAPFSLERSQSKEWEYITRINESRALAASSGCRGLVIVFEMDASAAPRLLLHVGSSLVQVVSSAREPIEAPAEIWRVVKRIARSFIPSSMHAVLRAVSDVSLTLEPLFSSSSSLGTKLTFERCRMATMMEKSCSYSAADTPVISREWQSRANCAPSETPSIERHEDWRSSPKFLSGPPSSACSPTVTRKAGSVPARSW
mmetsp:Transcript_37790/g.75710  ORF Transcript_37790/g.75710 Transcript_37790/m.75710 type:complete len:247 (-) Transcript_37790:438-1178(-)